MPSCPNCHRSTTEPFRLYGNHREFAPDGVGPRRNDPVDPLQSEDYLRYLNSATERFGENSLPLCMYCLSQQCDFCWLCHLPIDRIRPLNHQDQIDFGFDGLPVPPGQAILAATTVVAGNPETHYCDICLVAAE